MQLGRIFLTPAENQQRYRGWLHVLWISWTCHLPLPLAPRNSLVTSTDSHTPGTDWLRCWSTLTLSPKLKFPLRLFHQFTTHLYGVSCGLRFSTPYWLVSLQNSQFEYILSSTYSAALSCYHSTPATPEHNDDVFRKDCASYTLLFECGDHALILSTLLCVKVSDVARGQILLLYRCASRGSIWGMPLANQTSVNG